MSAVQKFLNPYKVEKGSAFTHTSLGKACASYYLPADVEEDFLTVYATAVENGEDLHITEKHRDVSPLLVDLDFRQVSNDRLYNDAMVSAFVDALKNQVVNYVDVNEQAIRFYVMEKLEPRPNKSGGFKDGLHIVSPDVVTKPEIQHIIRNNIINESMAGIFGNVFTNSYNDIYDAAVIEKNNWFMYGSKKDGEPFAWTITKIIDGNGAEVDNTHTDDELISLLSIRNKYDSLKVKADKVEEVNAYKAKHEKKPNDDDTASKPARVGLPADLETITKLTMMLNVERADRYSDWLNVGLCLSNINDRCLSIWEEFSKQSNKYKYGECSKLWLSFGYKTAGSKLTEGSLRYWARQDNPKAYAELMKDDVNKLIYLSRSGCHNDVAKVVHALYKDEFVCCYINDKPNWFEFKNHRWVECPKGVTLRQHLSNVVTKRYSSAAAYYHKKATEAETDEAQAVYAECGKMLGKIAMSLKNAPYKANIMKELEEIFAVLQADFYDKLDENKGLLAFNNGVYDLEGGCFRDGLPDDMVKFSSGYDYLTEDNEDNRQLINKFMYSMFESDEMVNYLWDTTAYALHGCKYEETITFMSGDGANGKGTYGKLLKNTLGDYYYEPSVSVFTCKKTSSSSANPELAKTKGKRFVMASEPEESDKFQIGAIKNWTGGDQIQARELFKNTVEFSCQFAIAIQMNNKPKLSDFDGGIARRLRLIHFPFKFVESPILANERQGDNKLKTRFETDKGIAQQFMRMLIERYEERIKGNKPVHVPKKVVEFTQEYLDANNVVKGFLVDHVEITNIDTDMILSNALFEAFRSSDYNTNNSNKNWFVEKMGANGFTSSRQTRRQLPYYDRAVFKGLKLKQNTCYIQDEDEH